MTKATNLNIPAGKDLHGKSAAVKRLTLVDFLRTNIPWIVLIVLCVILTITLPRFSSARNILNILRQSSVIGIVAVGMTFAMIGGSFDLSVGAIMGLTTVVVIQLQPTDGPTAALAVVIGLLIGVFMGWVNGYIVGRFETNSVVITIGTMNVILGLTLIYTQGKHVWVKNMFEPLAFLGSGSIGQFPAPIFILGGIAIIGYLLLSWTRFGRYLYATGSNPSSARLSGIDVGKIKMISYMFSGFAAAVGGIVIAARVQNVDPSYGIGYEFEVLTAVMLGGASLSGGHGSVLGTIAGVLLLQVITNAMALSGIPFEGQLMVKGIILVAVVAMNVIVQKRRGGR